MNHDESAEQPPAILQNGVAAHLRASSVQRGSRTCRSPCAASGSWSTSAIAWPPSWAWLRTRSIPIGRLLSLGLDSLSAMDLKIEIDAGLGTTLPLSMLMEGSGIRELAERASEHLAGAADPTVRRHPRRPSTWSPTNGSRTGSNCSGTLTSSQRAGAAYHIPGAATFRVELDIDAFRRAFGRVIARQDALRTTFTVVDEKPAIRLLDAERSGSAARTNGS